MTEPMEGAMKPMRSKASTKPKKVSGQIPKGPKKDTKLTHVGNLKHF